MAEHSPREQERPRVNPPSPPTREQAPPKPARTAGDDEIPQPPDGQGTHREVTGGFIWEPGPETPGVGNPPPEPGEPETPEPPERKARALHQPWEPGDHDRELEQREADTAAEEAERWLQQRQPQPAGAVEGRETPLRSRRELGGANRPGGINVVVVVPPEGDADGDDEQPPADPATDLSGWQAYWARQFVRRHNVGGGVHPRAIGWQNPDSAHGSDPIRRRDRVNEQVP